LLETILRKKTNNFVSEAKPTTGATLSIRLKHRLFYGHLTSRFAESMTYSRCFRKSNYPNDLSTEICREAAAPVNLKNSVNLPRFHLIRRRIIMIREKLS